MPSTVTSPQPTNCDPAGTLGAGAVQLNPSRPFLYHPKLGEIVNFWRSDFSAQETGTVCARFFGSREIEILTANDEMLRVSADKYEIFSE